MHNIFSFSDRATRSQFDYFMLATVAVFIVLIVWAEQVDAFIGSLPISEFVSAIIVSGVLVGLRRSTP